MTFTLCPLYTKRFESPLKELLRLILWAVDAADKGGGEGLGTGKEPSLREKGTSNPVVMIFYASLSSRMIS
jgi:hypothetical protein